LSRLGYLVRYWVLNARRLFHMLVGLAFLFLSLAGVTVTYSEWRLYQRAPEDVWTRFMLVAEGTLTLALVIFGLYSFVKARNVR